MPVTFSPVSALEVLDSRGRATGSAIQSNGVSAMSHAMANIDT